MMRGTAAALALAACVGCAGAQEGSTAITIYSSAEPGAVPAELYRPTAGAFNPYAQQQIPGFAIVRHDRTVALSEGRSELRFTDVAALLDPTTVRFESLTDPGGTSVVEQDYRFDLVSQQALIERYIDERIGVWQARGDSLELVTGTLLSASGGLILETGDGLRSINSYAAIDFPERPGGLLTRPTLVWDVFAETGGAHETRVSYETDGITWWADYNLVFEEGEDANSGLLDVGAWVSIVNRSGAAYPEAKLKLVAGDVQRVRAQQGRFDARQRGMVAAEAAPAGFEEKSFFEYHLYTLGRPTTLGENATKQIRLFDEAQGVPAEKVLVYDGRAQQYRGVYPSPMTDRNFGSQSNAKVDVYLRFANSEEAGLGVPLPKGRVRVSKADPADGSLEFIGEDTIDHTPQGEEVLIRLGSAFDVVGERTQTGFQVDSRRDLMEETIEISVRNRKDEPVDVIVKESLYRWTNWEITEASAEYERQDSRTIHFPITIEPDGERTITYTVRYTW